MRYGHGSRPSILLLLLLLLALLLLQTAPRLAAATGAAP